MAGGCFGMRDALLKVRRVSCQLSRAARRLAAQLSRIRAHRECPRPLFPQFRTNKTFSVRRKTMSKRELGKLASVVDVDAPRAKRRKEAPPQDEKKADADMDVDAGGAANVKREQEDPAKLEQVKEQGLRLWQTVKDAVDKECVTDLRRPAPLRRLPAYSHHPRSSQRPLPFSRFSPSPQQTHVPGLLHRHQETHRSRQDQGSLGRRPILVPNRSQERPRTMLP